MVHDKAFESALDLFCRTHNIVARRYGDPNITPYFHVVLVFIYHLTFFPSALAFIQKQFPWKLTSVLLDTFSASVDSFAKYENSNFPRPDNGEPPRPLPEDFAMRGLLWADRYYPNDWFSSDKVEDDEKYLEVASMSKEREDRCLWLGYQISKRTGALQYGPETQQFSVALEYEIDIDLSIEDA